MSFDDLFRKDRPNKILQLASGVSWRRPKRLKEKNESERNENI
jgi:hypothetical protein